MVSPLNFTIIKILVALVFGILLAHFNIIPSTDATNYLFVFLLLFLASFVFSKNRNKKSIWFGIIAMLLTSSIGLFSYYINDQRNNKKHYTNQWKTEQPNAPLLVVLDIREQLKSSNFYHKYIAEIKRINNTKSNGIILLNIKRNDFHYPLKIDQIIALRAPLSELPSPTNPYQFDYKNHLEQRDIYRQISADYDQISVLSSDLRSMSGHAAAFRDHIKVNLNKAGFKGDELAVMNALLLGQRQDIDNELYAAYARAGVIHILAVSGLHVGIILLILNEILKPMIYLKNGRRIKALTIIIGLWCFAVITGLSPSVTRAVTMFSLLSIAMHLKRPTNTYNTLALSALILLLIDPKNLFKVGFQMSYLAVLSIVFFHPLLSKLWYTNNKLLRFLWNTFTVTLSAQLGVLPISLYYFHQFPGLFFVANLVIVPFLGLILSLGVLAIALSLFNILPNWFASMYQGMIHLLNSFVKFISEQQQFLITNISFDFIEVVFFYIFIFYLGLFILKRSYGRIKSLLISVVLLQSVFIALKFKYNNERLVIFHKTRATILAIDYHASLYVYKDIDSSGIGFPKCISDYQIGNHIKYTYENSLQSALKFRNHSLLIVDSLAIYNIKSLKPDYILLRNSPKINLDRLIDTIKPIKIIADGSNYRTYIQRWKLTCRKRKLPFHYTGEKGAFILE